MTNNNCPRCAGLFEPTPDGYCPHCRQEIVSTAPRPGVSTADVCLSESLLNQYLTDDCADLECEWVERHVNRCATCEDRLRQLALVSRDRPQSRQLLVATTPADLQTTRVGDYKVLDLLGRGGFGDVYRAQHEKTGQYVAIKLLRRRSGANSLEEDESILAIRHPNIVPVYEIGTLDTGIPYIVSEFIDGMTLQARMRQRPFGHKEAARITSRIALGLHRIHTDARHLVHRDIKPANVLLDMNNEPHILDFGLVLSGDDYGNDNLPQGGTLYYMSPEQAQGNGAVADCRSDVFALGIIFYELLTGKHPFPGVSKSEVIRRITELDPRPPQMLDTSVPLEYVDVCLKALKKSPKDRYQTAEDMAWDLIDAEPLQLVRSINRKADEWAHKGKSNNDLIRWGQLREAKRLPPSYSAYLSTLGDEFLAASKRLERRWFMSGVAASGITTAMVVAASRKSGFDWSRTETDRLTAQSGEYLDRRPQLSVLLAVEAIKASRQAGKAEASAAIQCLRDSLSLIGGQPLWGIGDFHGHDGDVNSVALHASRWLVTCGRDNRALLWDLQNSAAKPTTLQGHHSDVTSAAISNSGRWIATRSRDNAVMLYERARDGTISQALVLDGHTKPVVATAFSPQDRWLVTKGSDTALLRWDLNDPSRAEEFQAKSDWTSPLAVSPHGEVATAGRPGSIVVCRVDDPSARPIRLHCDSAAIHALSFSSDGRWFAAAGSDRTVYLWERVTDTLVPLPESKGHDDQISALAFCPANRFLASASDDGSVRLWDLHMATPVKQLLGHTAKISTLEFSSDGLWLIAASEDQTICRWDYSSPTATRALIYRGHDGPVTSVAIDTTERRFISASKDGSVRIWHLDAVESSADPVVFAAQPPADSERGGKRMVVQFTPDGRWLFTGSRNEIKRWDWAGLSSPSPPAEAFNAKLVASDFGNVVDLSVDEEGKWLFAVGDRRMVRWNLSQLDSSQVSYSYTFDVDPTAVLTVGPHVFTGDRAGNVQQFELSEPAVEPVTIVVHPSSVVSLAVRAVNDETTQLTSLSRDGTLNQYDLSAGATAKSRRVGDQDRFEAFAVSPDGKQFVVSSSWNPLRVHHFDEQRDSDELTNDIMAPSSALAFASRSSGVVLISGDLDGEISIWTEGQIWKGEPGRAVVMATDKRRISRVVVSPTTNRQTWIVAANEGANVRCWRLALSDLIELARTVVGRDFTQQECAQLFAGERRRAFEQADAIAEI